MPCTIQIHLSFMSDTLPDIMVSFMATNGPLWFGYDWIQSPIGHYVTIVWHGDGALKASLHR